MGDAQPALGAQYSPPCSQRGCPGLWHCCEGLPTPAWLVQAQPAADPGWKQGKKNLTELRISSLNPIQEQSGASLAPGSPALPSLGPVALSMSRRPRPELGSRTGDAGGCRGQGPPRASPGGLLPCSAAPLCCPALRMARAGCGQRGRQLPSGSRALHLCGGGSSGSVLIVGRLEGTQRAHPDPAALPLPRLEIKPRFSCKDAQWLTGKSLPGRHAGSKPISKRVSNYSSWLFDLHFFLAHQMLMLRG